MTSIPPFTVFIDKALDQGFQFVDREGDVNRPVVLQGFSKSRPPFLSTALAFSLSTSNKPRGAH